jgi:hypothetical protein
MLCAHTIRRLKPGTFDQFVEAFVPAGDDPPRGWVRFHALRSLADPDEVVTFGFFDGSVEELERSQDDSDFDERRAAIAPLVEAVITNGIYEVAVSRVPDSRAAT